jgi:hypothetical protein
MQIYENAALCESGEQSLALAVSFVSTRVYELIYSGRHGHRLVGRVYAAIRLQTTGVACPKAAIRVAVTDRDLPASGASTRRRHPQIGARRLIEAGGALSV